MKLTHVIALAGVGAIALVGAALAAGSSWSGSSPAIAAETAKASVAKVALPTIRQRHTQADMMALDDGISYDDAARTLGTLGHAEGRNVAVNVGLTVGGNVTAYAWPNPDGSRVVLVFQHDRLVHRQLEGAN